MPLRSRWRTVPTVEPFAATQESLAKVLPQSSPASLPPKSPSRLHDIVKTKKARASTSRSSGRLFSRNSDYEEVEGEKHPPVIQPVAPLIVKPDITNHLLSNAYLSRPEPCGQNPLRTTEPHSCRVSTNDLLIVTISQNRATPVWRDLEHHPPAGSRHLCQASISFTGL